MLNFRKLCWKITNSGVLSEKLTSLPLVKLPESYGTRSLLPYSQKTRDVLIEMNRSHTPCTIKFRFDAKVPSPPRYFKLSVFFFLRFLIKVFYAFFFTALDTPLLTPNLIILSSTLFRRCTYASFRLLTGGTFLAFLFCLRCQTFFSSESNSLPVNIIVCVCVWEGGGGWGVDGQISPVTQRHRRIYVPLSLLQQRTEACEHRLGDVNISTHLSFRLFLVREILGAHSGFD